MESITARRDAPNAESWATMRVLLQRVRRASVRVGDEILASIGPGLAILVGVGRGDGESEVRPMADRVTKLRIFDDAAGKMNLSAVDVGAEVLVVSQFTLYADTRRGRRPGFSDAAPPEIAEPLVDRFAELLRESGLRVGTGRFGAHMLVEIHNDGPVTIWLETSAGQ
jgi:D-aminoacyl-tRNA deacylase